MKSRIVSLTFVLVLLCCSTVFAQHSLQIDNGGGAYTVIFGSAPGGTYIIPPGGGTFLTQLSGSPTVSNAWLQGGNTNAASPIPNYGTIGTLDNVNMSFVTNGLANVRMTIFNNGNISMNTTAGDATIGRTGAGATNLNSPTIAIPNIGTTASVSNVLVRSGNNMMVSSLNVITGTGTTNFIPRWTPNGSTLGDSRIFDDGVGSMTINANLIPSTDNTRTLGDATHRWQEVYVGPASLHVVGTAPVRDYAVGINGGGDLTITETGLGTPAMTLTLNGFETVTGGFNFPATTNTGAGIIYQNGTRFISSFGTDNFFAGSGTGNTTLTGTGNNAIGRDALRSTTTGSQNSAFGHTTLVANTTGSNNSAFGNSALKANISGTGNTAIGSNTLEVGTNLNRNTAVGMFALQANTTNDNTAVGYEAMKANTSGGANTALGNAALKSNTTGGFNTATGISALMSNTTGSNNTANGFGALNSNIIGQSNTAFGYAALYNNTTDYNTGVGYAALGTNTSGNFNTCLGATAMRNNTIGYFNTATGGNALYNNIDGFQNTASGLNAMYANTSGFLNIAIGAYALASNTIGNRNTVVGEEAMFSSVGADLNTAIGYLSMFSNINGQLNTACGMNSLYNCTGNLNSAFGKDALYSTTSGLNNTGVGYQAGTSNTTGSDNTFVGNTANASAGNLSNATAIGAFATVCASNSMVFGSNAVTAWGFGVCPAAGNAIQVGTGAGNGNGARLTSGGVWTNGSSRSFKERFTPLNGEEVLSKINALNVLGWYYKGTNEYHIGPIAEDFYKTFSTGDQANPSETQRYISSVDPAGVALIGVQELAKKNEEQAARIKALEEKIELLEKLLVK
jgi:hypothetical protein